MTKNKGLRQGTRKKFARPFGKNGMPAPSTYIRSFKLGDPVDIVANGAIHKGMPYKFYHGRTGRVWNVTPRAIGVVVNKKIGNRLIAKRLHVRLEHVKKSTSLEGHLARCRYNDKKTIAVKKGTEKWESLKRPNNLPPGGVIVRTRGTKVQTLHPLPYQLLC